MIGVFVEWNPGRKNSPGWIIDGNGCHIWVGAVFRKGYGKVLWRGSARGAHTARYEREVGLVAKGFELHHACRNPICCNPAHLQPLTKKEHTLLGTSPPARHARKTHCDNGHEFDFHNGRYRVCITCARESKKLYERHKRIEWKAANPGKPLPRGSYK